MGEKKKNSNYVISQVVYRAPNRQGVKAAIQISMQIPPRPVKERFELPLRSRVEPVQSMLLSVSHQDLSYNSTKANRRRKHPHRR